MDWSNASKIFLFSSESGSGMIGRGATLCRAPLLESCCASYFFSSYDFGLSNASMQSYMLSDFDENSLSFSWICDIVLFNRSALESLFESRFCGDSTKPKSVFASDCEWWFFTGLGSGRLSSFISFDGKPAVMYIFFRNSTIPISAVWPLLWLFCSAVAEPLV